MKCDKIPVNSEHIKNKHVNSIILIRLGSNSLRIKWCNFLVSTSYTFQVMA